MNYDSSRCKGSLSCLQQPVVCGGRRREKGERYRLRDRKTEREKREREFRGEQFCIMRRQKVKSKHTYAKKKALFSSHCFVV